MIRNQFSKSILSGGLVYVFSILIGNILQFYLLLNVNENFRTDLTVTISFTLSVLLNFFIHNKYVFMKKFSFRKLFNFYITNSADLFIHVIFWNVFENFYGSPNILIFNILSASLVLTIYPVKYLIYKFIFRN